MLKETESAELAAQQHGNLSSFAAELSRSVSSGALQFEPWPLVVQVDHKALHRLSCAAETLQMSLVLYPSVMSWSAETWATGCADG